jgi:hypothetical protein
MYYWWEYFLKKFSILILILSLFTTTSFSTPGPGSGAWSAYKSASSDAESKASDAAKVSSSVEEVRDLINDSKLNPDELLDSATSKAKEVVNQVGEIFTPDKLLLGSIATVVGLNLGGILIDGFINSTTGALSYITKKLVEDVEKINYEIFYKELERLEKALSDFDKIVEAASKAEKLIKLESQLKPLFLEKVGDIETRSFIEKVSCDPKLSVLAQAKTRSKLNDLIKRFKGGDYDMRRLCFQLAKMDELESKISSIARILSIKFNDMKSYRLEKVRNEAEDEMEAWIDREDENNSFINIHRKKALSCISNPKKVQGTLLEKVSKHQLIKTDFNGDFDFQKVWNKYFSSHSVAFRNGFSRQMSQTNFQKNLRLGKQIWNIRCGSQRLKKCMSDHAPGYASSFQTDAQVYKSLMRTHAKIQRGENIGASEETIYSKIMSQINEDSLPAIKSPFGNMIFSTGPSSVEFYNTTYFAKRKVASPDISDMRMLSCEHSFIAPDKKKLCKAMILGMKQVMENGCSQHFINNDIVKKAENSLEIEKQRRLEAIEVSIIEEQNKLNRLENFVNMISSPDIRDLEGKLRELADKHDAYIQSGMCRAN